MKLIISEHAFKRAKERLLIEDKDEFIIKTRKALVEGIPIKKIKKRIIRGYIQRLYDNTKRANNIVMYEKNAYLFKNSILITVIDLPKKLFK